MVLTCNTIANTIIIRVTVRSHNYSLRIYLKVYFLTPTCSDHAPAPCTVTTTLTITSANSNLSPPVFAAASYTVDIPENYPVLNVIFTANATDTDIGTNGIISYSFVNPQIEFSIDSGICVFNIIYFLVQFIKLPSQRLEKFICHFHLILSLLLPTLSIYWPLMGPLSVLIAGVPPRFSP